MPSSNASSNIIYFSSASEWSESNSFDTSVSSEDIPEFDFDTLDFVGKTLGGTIVVLDKGNLYYKKPNSEVILFTSGVRKVEIFENQVIVLYNRTGKASDLVVFTESFKNEKDVFVKDNNFHEDYINKYLDITDRLIKDFFISNDELYVLFFETGQAEATSEGDGPIVIPLTSSSSSSQSSFSSSSSSSFDERCEPLISKNIKGFGYSVSTNEDGEFVVIGSPEENKVYIYRIDPTIGQTGFELIQTVLGFSNSDFGYSVSFALNNSLVIGSPGFNNNEGIVYVYNQTTSTSWNLQNTLIGVNTFSQDNNFEFGSRFGNSVSINEDGNFIVVGCPYYTNDLNFDLQQGAVFTYINGTLQNIIQPLDIQQNDLFGWKVDTNLLGDRFIASSIGDTTGSVYVYEFSTTWNQTEKLEASDSQPNSYFGWSISLANDGNIISIGAYKDNNQNGINAGAVYTYSLIGGTWNETKLLSSDGRDGESFGMSVSLNSCGSGLAVTSLYFDFEINPYNGKLYLFNLSGLWNEEIIIESKIGEDNYGFNVSLSDLGDHVAVSAPQKGYVSVYNLEEQCYDFTANCVLLSSVSSSSQSSSSTSSSSISSQSSSSTSSSSISSQSSSSTSSSSQSSSSTSSSSQSSSSSLSSSSDSSSSLSSSSDSSSSSSSSSDSSSSSSDSSSSSSNSSDSSSSLSSSSESSSSSSDSSSSLSSSSDSSSSSSDSSSSSSSSSESSSESFSSSSSSLDSSSESFSSSSSSSESSSESSSSSSESSSSLSSSSESSSSSSDSSSSLSSSSESSSSSSEISSSSSESSSSTSLSSSSSSESSSSSSDGVIFTLLADNEGNFIVDNEGNYILLG